MADVFVSYDRRDREIAEKVVSSLTEQGLTVWWDDRITPHETWDKTIEREVDSAKRVLVIWTNNSVQSDWVRTEAGAAKESTPPKLIQARFTDCKVPLAFRLLQHVDLIGWSPKRKHSGWDRLIGWLKDGIEQPAAPAPGGGGPIPPEPAASAPVEAPAVSASAAEPVAPPPAVAAPVQTPEPAPAPAASAPVGLAALPPQPAPAAAPPLAEPSVATSTASTSGPIPKIEMPRLGAGGGSGGGIDKRLLIGGGIALGVVVVAAIGFMVLPGLMGVGSGAAAGGFSGEERATLGGYLDGYAEEYAPGLEAVIDDELARIAPMEAYDFEVELGEGESLRVLGACDTNCSDVDLYVTAPDGTELGSDVLTDDYPVVDFQTDQAGWYAIRIAMPGCSAETCIGAARVYAVD